MPSLSDIPVEVLLDNLLPLIPIQDLLQLGSTNKLFALLCADDTFWKRKLQADFNFSGAGTARTSGWKLIYRGLRKPRVFVWGEKSHGRLGLLKFPKSTIPHVPFPTQLHIPGVRVVSLIAGGMSFHALDSEGNVYVWGTMDGTTFTLDSDGFSESGKKSDTPLRLQLPAATRSVSCGRLHSTTLDSKGHIWTFLSFGRPFRLSSPLLANTSPDSSPLQIECGWSFSSVLTKSGDVLVWWPFSGQMSSRIISKNEEMDLENDKKAHASDGVIPCVTWDLEIDPIRLPQIPPLPELLNTGAPEDQNKGTQLVQIAALDRHIIGLTNRGHVLKFGSLVDETTVSRGNWEYLPAFSDIAVVRKHEAFSSEVDEPVEAPQTMRITHISANFESFIAYSTGSSSIVLMGRVDTNSTSEPEIIPALQNKSVISVVLGDYHSGALTSTGKLLTWGAYSAGSLGLGDPATLEPGTPGGFSTETRRLEAASRGRGTPPRVNIPTEVRFDHGEGRRKERFCFSAAAAGWHMGALVIDLEPENIDDGDDDNPLTNPDQDHSRPMSDRLPVPLPQPPFIPHGPGEMPILPLGPGGGAFRVGYPGRGMNPHQGSSSAQPEFSQEPGEVPLVRGGRGRRIHRIGFAGRGMNRGSIGGAGVDPS